MKNLIFLLFFFAFSASAQDSPFDRFMHKSIGGGLHTVGIASNGTPIPAERISNLTPGAGWSYAGKMSAATHAEGVEVRGRAQIPVGSGAKVPVNVSTVIPKTSILAAMTRCMGNVYCALAVGVGSSALSDWVSRTGYSFNPNATSEDNLVSQALITCTSGCFWWTPDGTTANYGSIAQACTALAVMRNQSYSSHGDTLPVRCFNANNQFYGYVYRGQSRAPDSVTYGPFGQQHIDALSTLPVPGEVIVPLYGRPNYQNGVTLGADGLKTSFSTDSPVYSPPNTQKVITTETIKNPDGSTSTKETTKSTGYKVLDLGQGVVKLEPVTTTEVKIDGQIVPELGKVETGKPSDETQIETCGLPNTPACKINEDGTPEAVQDTHKQDVDNALSDLNKLGANPTTFWPKLPEIRWDFALPTGCAAIAISAFSPWLQEIDVCQFQPIFHDIMSAVWVLGGLFGAISIFWRSTFAKAA